MLRAYEGNLGKFEYDDAVFAISDEDTLKYIGSETNGKNINVPDGLVDGTGLFEETDIKTGANLPDSIRKMSRMYYGCANMTEAGVIPDGVTDIDSAYAYTKIQETPQIPDSVKNADFAFDHCNDLERCVNFSDNLETANCMFSGDRHLTQLPEKLPESLRYMNGFASDCQNLEHAPLTCENVKEMDHAYASCQNLKVQPYVPDGASAENVISDCYKLEHQDEASHDKSLSQVFKAAEPAHIDRDAALAEATASIEHSTDPDNQIQR